MEQYIYYLVGIAFVLLVIGFIIDTSTNPQMMSARTSIFFFSGVLLLLFALITGVTNCEELQTCDHVSSKQKAECFAKVKELKKLRNRIHGQNTMKKLNDQLTIEREK